MCQVECPTGSLKTWKLELELEISSSSQVRFNHYQFQVFKFKTWRTWKFQVKSSLKSYKLDLTWNLLSRWATQQTTIKSSKKGPNFIENLCDSYAQCGIQSDIPLLLRKLFNALKCIPPTSVEAERAFQSQVNLWPNFAQNLMMIH